MLLFLFDSTMTIVYARMRVDPNATSVHLHEFRNGEGETYDMPCFDISLQSWQIDRKEYRLTDTPIVIDHDATHNDINNVDSRAPILMMLSDNLSTLYATHRFSSASTNAHVHESIHDEEIEVRCLDIDLNSGNIHVVRETSVEA